MVMLFVSRKEERHNSKTNSYLRGITYNCCTETIKMKTYNVVLPMHQKLNTKLYLTFFNFFIYNRILN